MLEGSIVALVLAAQATVGSITVSLDQPGHSISPTFFGLMTEEINHSYDGGLYGELIQNRVFKDNPKVPVHWHALPDAGAASLSIDNSQPVPETALDTCLKIERLNSPGTGPIGVANDGFWGIPLKPHTTYRASFWAKAGDPTASVDLALQSHDGSQTYATGHIKGITAAWHKYSIQLKTGDLSPTKDGRFSLTTRDKGALWLTQVSLFPPTFHNRPNGNRIDLMEKLIGMHPTFLRMPGGNYLEGNSFKERFDWKKTIGPIEQRPGHQGPWGYRSSDGLGLLEFLEWCEDMKAQPILAVFASYSLNHETVASGPVLQGFVQDALDEIEYVTGGPETTWGARRIKDGHPKPFPLNYVEVGNEDWAGTQYDARFAAFYNAIHAKYPKLQIIATAKVNSATPELVDDHYYRKAVTMMSDSGHYDQLSRSGPQVFVGEWASTDATPWSVVPVNSTTTFHEAMGDAAWLTGLERDSDLVKIQCYAPLLTNINPRGAQWGVNLIGYDNLDSFGSPSYYVQSLFAGFTGKETVPTAVQASLKPQAEPISSGEVGLGTYRTAAEYRDFTVTGPDGKVLVPQASPDSSHAWTLRRGGWALNNDGISQTEVATTDTIATIGDPSLTDFTIHVKARKIAGDEGFCIEFHYKDRDNRTQWNIGGWNNTRTVFQHFGGASDESGNVSDFKVETNRWYDLELRVHGSVYEGYIDGKLISRRTGPSPTPVLFTAASRDGKTLYLKVVNAADTEAPLNINLAGVDHLDSTATGYTLTGDPTSKNSIEAPLKIAPQPITVTGVAPQFQHTFPAHSVTVLRINFFPRTVARSR